MTRVVDFLSGLGHAPTPSRLGSTTVGVFVLDVVFVAGILALVAVIALIAKAVERL